MRAFAAAGVTGTAIGRSSRRVGNGEYTRDDARWTGAVAAWRGEGEVRNQMAISGLPLRWFRTDVRILERAFDLSSGWDTRPEIP